MRRHLITTVLILTAVSSVGLLTSMSGTTSPPGVESPAAIAFATAKTPEIGNDSSLIVHEWGTFTSFAGADGVPLRFRPLATSDLPSFVFNLADVLGQSLRKHSLTAFQRMETPVTYFYTPVEQDVSVRVEFPDGLLTEFYPPPRQLNPTRQTFVGNGLFTGSLSTADSTNLKESMLDWGRIHLIPTNRLVAQVDDRALSAKIGRHVERTIVPDSRRHVHYAKARNTDSAIVQLPADRTTSSSTTASTPDYFEKFLFYRGVSNFESLVTVRASGNDRFVVTGNGRNAVTSLFLVSTDGKRIRFSTQASLDAGTTVNMSLPTTHRSIDDLSSAVVTSLVAEGLYQKEAQAMVDTWSESWFNEPGTRLFYVLPQAKTDELLPLYITPEPQETVRIMVGRLEFMTPEQEHQVEASLQEWLAAKPSEVTDQQRYDVDMTRLQSLGRWAEPSLSRIRNTTSNENIRSEAARLLAFIRNNAQTLDSQLVQ